eukprot:3915488-Pyramimonas_sp.AAC.2
MAVSAIDNDAAVMLHKYMNTPGVAAGAYSYLTRRPRMQPNPSLSTGDDLRRREGSDVKITNGV